MNPTIDLNQLVRRWLDSLCQAGVRDLPNPDGRTDFIPMRMTPEPVRTDPGSVRAGPHLAPERAPAFAPGAANGTVPPPESAGSEYSAAMTQEERMARLLELKDRIATCVRCEELARCRTQTVFGIGPPAPRLVFFGEAPGADEDRIGEPFVGAAGALLNRIIAACKMKREEVYILNTIKCRPPGNRNPHDHELRNCREYWESQLDLLQPEFICVLGSVAAKTLLNATESISRLRGRFFPYRGSKVMVTYHPAYLLRTPEAKARTWEDMKMLMREMGIEL